jgi:hypothetical protein
VRQFRLLLYRLDKSDQPGASDVRPGLPQKFQLGLVVSLNSIDFDNRVDMLSPNTYGSHGGSQVAASTSFRASESLEQFYTYSRVQGVSCSSLRNSFNERYESRNSPCKVKLTFPLSIRFKARRALASKRIYCPRSCVRMVHAP